MTVNCEVCGVPLAGVVCPSCGLISSTPYSCSVCGHPIATVMCSTCAQSAVRHYRGPSQSSEMGEVCRRAAIIIPIALIALFLLLLALGGI